MPLFPINPNNITGVTNRSVMYVNPTTSVNMTYGIVGLSGENIASHGLSYDKTIKPFSTGWQGIDATGRYVYASENNHHGEPVESVLIYNPGPTAIRVGYNIITSGDWANETGFPLGSGDSIQFGGVNIGTIRNAWAKTTGGSAGNSGQQIIYIQTYPKDHWV